MKGILELENGEKWEVEFDYNEFEIKKVLRKLT